MLWGFLSIRTKFRTVIHTHQISFPYPHLEGTWEHPNGPMPNALVFLVDACKNLDSCLFVITQQASFHPMFKLCFFH